MTEEWRPLPGYEGLYDVSDQGRVRSMRSGINTAVGHIRREVIDHKGYRRVHLSRDGKPKAYRVHQLVALAFIGECPDGYQVNHKDGNKVNNQPSNLEYVTPLENVRHSIATGLRTFEHTKGAANPAAKLNEGDVRLIKYMLKNTDMSQREIGEKFGVGKDIISLIHTGRNWKDVTFKDNGLSNFARNFNKWWLKRQTMTQGDEDNGEE